MPPYSGTNFQVLLRAPHPDARVIPTTVTARVWESCITNCVPSLPSHLILGRIRNLDVELFGHYPSLETELLSLDYTVRPFDASTRMSVYPDTLIKDRNLVQKLQDQLCEALRDDGEEIAYGLVAETQSTWMLIVKFDRERYNPENPCPPTFETHGVKHNTIGYILDDDVFITAAEKDVKRFYLSKPPWVIYKILDKTNMANYAIHLAEQKAEKVAEHKREKRRAKKIAEKKGKGTEQERQGVIEAGEDTRRGGKGYKKQKDESVDVDAEIEETDINLQNLTISLPSQHSKLAINTTAKPLKPTTIITTSSSRPISKQSPKNQNPSSSNNKHGSTTSTTKQEAEKNGVWDMPRNKDAAIDSIRRPNWFFSGENDLKEG